MKINIEDWYTERIDDEIKFYHSYTKHLDKIQRSLSNELIKIPGLNKRELALLNSGFVEPSIIMLKGYFKEINKVITKKLYDDLFKITGDALNNFEQAHKSIKETLNNKKKPKSPVLNEMFKPGKFNKLINLLKDHKYYIENGIFHGEFKELAVIIYYCRPYKDKKYTGDSLFRNEYNQNKVIEAFFTYFKLKPSNIRKYVGLENELAFGNNPKYEKFLLQFNFLTTLY
jgi:hypothetical protein